MERIIAQGAEAILIKKDANLIKRRIVKLYRHTALDSMLRKRRNKKEAKLLEKAGKIINIPKIISADEKNAEIKMEFINGKVLSKELDNMKNSLKVCYEIGKSIALLHNHNIIHGDLTTSNMIFKNNRVYFIDFGLGFDSAKIEDKAVDLHLLKQAFESKHFKHWEKYYKESVKGYKENSKEAKLVLERLEKVEKRGRYKRKKREE